MKKRVLLWAVRFDYSGRSVKLQLGNMGVIDADSCRATTGTLLLLDCDNRKAPSFRALAGRFQIFKGAFSVRCISYSRTMRGWHIVAEVDIKLTPPEIIALQAIMGSDVKREAMNMTRWLGMRGKRVDKFWLSRWNLLFKEKL